MCARLCRPRRLYHLFKSSLAFTPVTHFAQKKIGKPIVDPIAARWIIEKPVTSGKRNDRRTWKGGTMTLGRALLRVIEGLNRSRELLVDDAQYAAPFLETDLHVETNCFDVWLPRLRHLLFGKLVERT